MEKWVVSAKRADFAAIAERFHIDQVTARIIRNRDVVTEEEIEEYLTGTLDSLASPHLLMDCDKAAGILAEKIREQKAVRIIGDYDIDGVCSTYILLSGQNFTCLFPMTAARTPLSVSRRYYRRRMFHFLKK